MAAAPASASAHGAMGMSLQPSLGLSARVSGLLETEEGVALTEYATALGAGVIGKECGQTLVGRTSAGAPIYHVFASLASSSVLTDGAGSVRLSLSAIVEDGVYRKCEAARTDFVSGVGSYSVQALEISGSQVEVGEVRAEVAGPDVTLFRGGVLDEVDSQALTEAKLNFSSRAAASGSTLVLGTDVVDTSRATARVKRNCNRCLDIAGYIYAGGCGLTGVVIGGIVCGPAAVICGIIAGVVSLIICSPLGVRGPGVICKDAGYC